MTRLSLEIPSYSNSISLDPNTRSIVTVSTFLLFVNLILKNELIRDTHSSYIKFFIIISAAYCKQFKQPVIELDLDNDRLLNYLSYIEY